MLNDRLTADGDTEPKPDSSGIDRRSILRATSGLGLATGIAGCSSILGQSSDGGDGSGNSNSGKEVHFLTDESSDSFQKFFGQVKEDFESETDYTVKMEFVGVGGNAEDRLAQLLQAGDPPEVYLSSASQASLFLNQGSVAPVSDAFSSISERFGEPDSNWRVQKNDEDYIVPLWGNMGITWYRTDVWGDSTPETWDQILQGAKQADGQNNLKGTFVPAGTDICTDLFVLGWAYSNDATVCTREDGEIRVIMAEGENRTRWVETMQFLQDLHQYSPKNSDAGCSQMSQALASETSSRTWYVGSRPKNQPITQNKSFTDSISAQVQPTPKAGEAPMTAGLAEGLVTFNGSNTEGANAYIDFLFKPKYLNQIYFLTPLQNMPAFPKITSTDDYQQQMEETVSNTAFTQADVKAAETSAQNFQTLASETNPPNPYSGAIMSSRKLSELIFEVTVQGTAPETAVDQYAKEIKNVVDDARS